MLHLLFKKVEGFINDNKDHATITGGVSEEKVKFIENELNVNLPESYRWFLKKYGSGGIYAANILGYDLVSASVVEKTKEYRELYNLNEGLVVIEDIDIFAYCLDTNKMIDGECPVVVWATQGGYGRTVEQSFLTFLFERLKEKKEIWEEDEDWDGEE
ncbi:SMI1/KNR4 family protein [Bacillus haynesii]|nr:SMI1/KNR4 family protein [Bacillus haynesii]MCY8756001.1 SMI1/KNR4 family protein [Bacillus haynesii]MCY9263913.1 SMI1/KNR4 family protein [Bacillus haynesii]